MGYLMHVIEVIPLKKGVAIESLSYYSSVAYEPGTLISIPVRKRTIPGVVVDIRSVSTAKAALRTATFSLRKLPPQETAEKLPTTILTTAREILKTTPAQLGSILFSILPPDVRTGDRSYPQLPDHTGDEMFVPSVLTATAADRYIAYRSHIRESFAHRGSVLFVVPTSAAVEQAEALLSKGIEKRVVTLASTHGKKRLDAAYEKFEDLRQSKLIITTPNFAFLCRHDITTIIIENAGSLHYISRSRPYLDARETLRVYARILCTELIIGDNVPPTETEVARREERYATYEEHATRLQIPSSLALAKHPKESPTFSLITKELAEYIDVTLANRGRVFLYASRRGLAPIVLCRDCGHIFRCPDSGAPYSLLRTGSGENEKRWFYCATSGARVPAADVCPDCGSWRLIEQGIGIQQVYDHIKQHYPQINTVLMDHQTAGTHPKAKRLSQQFYDERRSILIGSNLALPYLTKPIECIGIISYEAMRSVPTWRADETVFHTLLTLREIASKDLVVQTRSEPDELITLAKKGLVDQFYTGEIELRRSLGYPPFSVFILLTFVGSKPQVVETEALISRSLAAFSPMFYNGPLSRPEKTIRFGLIRLPAEQFPDATLLQALTELPPYIKVEVNPAKII